MELKEVEISDLRSEISNLEKIESLINTYFETTTSDELFEIRLDSLERDKKQL